MKAIILLGTLKTGGQPNAQVLTEVFVKYLKEEEVTVENINW